MPGRRYGALMTSMAGLAQYSDTGTGSSKLRLQLSTNMDMYLRVVVSLDSYESRPECSIVYLSSVPSLIELAKGVLVGTYART